MQIITKVTDSTPEGLAHRIGQEVTWGFIKNEFPHEDYAISIEGDIPIPLTDVAATITDDTRFAVLVSYPVYDDGTPGENYVYLELIVDERMVEDGMLRHDIAFRAQIKPNSIVFVEGEECGS